MEEYKRKYQNIRFINNPGKIQSIAFNIGVKASDAPYIVRLDAHALYNSVGLFVFTSILGAQSLNLLTLNGLHMR